MLAFDDVGSFTFSEDGTVAASGTSSIQANELTWETDSYCDAEVTGKATYTWAFEDGILLFRVKGDEKRAYRFGVRDDVRYHKED